MITVIVPSYNDRTFLARLFESLFSCDPGIPFRCVIVDDWSNDGTETFIRSELASYSAIIRPERKAYFTRSANVGLDWSMTNTKSTYHFLLNSDTYVTDGWAAGLVGTHQKFQAGIVGATLLYPNGLVQHAGAYGAGYHFGINQPFLHRQSDRIVPWVTGAAMSIHRDVLNRVGYLPHPPQFKQYDASDRDFCIAARIEHGVEIAVSAACIIYHDTHQAEAVRKQRGDY